MRLSSKTLRNICNLLFHDCSINCSYHSRLWASEKRFPNILLWGGGVGKSPSYCKVIFSLLTEIDKLNINRSFENTDGSAHRSYTTQAIDFERLTVTQVRGDMWGFRTRMQYRKWFKDNAGSHEHYFQRIMSVHFHMTTKNVELGQPWMSCLYRVHQIMVQIKAVTFKRLHI